TERGAPRCLKGDNGPEFIAPAIRHCWCHIGRLVTPHYRKFFTHRYSMQGRHSEGARRVSDGVTRKARNLKGIVGALLVLLCPRVSVANTFIAFGPKTYRYAPGKPAPQSTSFTVLNPATTYTLRIHNGGLSNEFNRVSSAVITLNGVEIAKPNDFN